MDKTMTPDEIGCGPFERVVAEAVDAEFYAFVYGDLPAGVTASAHYASAGWLAGHDPNPWFSTRAYLEENDDVAASGMVPLFHFLQSGAAEGRAFAPSPRAYEYYDREPGSLDTTVVYAPSAAPLPDEGGPYERSVVAEEFDEAYYLAVNPDVGAAGVDPLAHFLTNGWHEGRDPSAYFSVRKYLEVNVDVAEAGVNPFFHFLATGRSEGRPERLDVGFRYDVLANLETVEKRMAAIPAIAIHDLGTEMQLRNAVGSLRRSVSRGLHLSVSHDDYTANVGGLQACLSREAHALARLDIDHVHLFPGRPLLVTERDPDSVIGVLVNGSPAGLFTAPTIARVFLTAFDANAGERSLAIHSCLGHSTEALATIFRALRLESGYFWIHDFASACTGYSLLRNDVEFCGAPPITSSACGLCIYGERRSVQVADHARLFAEFDLTVVAPSESALAVWKSASAFESRNAVVHPHCRLVHRASGRAASPRTRLRVAFLGYPNVHKGWPVFRELVRRFGRDDRFEFHHLGMFPEKGSAAMHTEVVTRIDSPAAMIDAVESLDIDVALIWSLWPETFCFTAYEAIAGGAAVVAPLTSGNVAAVIRETGKGLVVSDEHELYELFASGGIESLAISNRGAEHFSLEYSNMTADLIGSLV